MPVANGALSPGAEIDAATIKDFRLPETSVYATPESTKINAAVSEAWRSTGKRVFATQELALRRQRCLAARPRRTG